MGIPTTEAKLQFKYNATLGECPVWDVEKELLYWVDILSGELYCYDPKKEENSVYQIDEHVGSLALRKKGGAVLALKSGFALYDFGKQKITHLTDPIAHLPNQRFNDGKCDPQGCFWAGTLSYDVQPGVGSLFCLNQNFTVSKKLGKLTIPNGMAWDTDPSTFYFIDSPDRTIYSFDFDEKTGEVSKRSEVFELDEEDAVPDGMTMDTEGKLWVALYNGYKVLRIDPDNGDIMHQVLLPVPQVTSCTFGGPEMNELYITTAREHMTDKDIEEFPLSGSLFKVTLPYKGTPPARFMG
ncbi:SMP-30/gluconolactonase/LRE family protein [Aliifodinibius sp. S!AR15-10]|uniref:SMP-30/gluconolactonase/LRE family protein n=1 Tax=Aliifodinibius sp. S!AR15-10 TaxID=2950437 RepID=UPI00285A292C|nr:SMP-30/gluconolactonase/LRE family protein [Aliifodinibius sp. S!AR15-10]MDR8390954.1 SMP-30/gluconolactonase/LRE family protein [Aliifodinibius sp. S!AR15-10]